MSETPFVESPLFASDTYRLHRRFDRMGRLIGDGAMAKLLRSHVMVIGLGGVGSFAAESLARSGVGRLTVVDFDEICITNFNRQLHSLQGLVGQPKAKVMGDRLRKINPRSQVVALPLFYNARTNPEIFGAPDEPKPDFVVDAIDNVTAKCHLLAYCRDHKIPVVSSTGSGGRLDPTQIQVGDLGKTEMDPLARAIRRILREQYGFPKEEGSDFGIPSVYSRESAEKPHELHYDQGQGFRCVCPQKENEFFQCDNRNLIYGNASFVTGTFGLFCASVAVKALIES